MQLAHRVGVDFSEAANFYDFTPLSAEPNFYDFTPSSAPNFYRFALKIPESFSPRRVDAPRPGSL